MKSINFRQLSSIVLFSLCAFIGVGAKASVTTGNSRGAIVVEEFFDYQCPHCRIMLENTEKLAQNNQEVKLVTRVVPLLDRNSWFIARAALAARKQGKYYALHHLLMRQREYISQERLLNLAKAAGLNIAQLQRDMRSKAIAGELGDNISASRGRGVDVIPAVFVYRTNNRASEIRIVGDKTYSDLQDSLTKL